MGGGSRSLQRKSIRPLFFFAFAITLMSWLSICAFQEKIHASVGCQLTKTGVYTQEPREGASTFCETKPLSSLLSAKREFWGLKINRLAWMLETSGIRRLRGHPSP